MYLGARWGYKLLLGAPEQLTDILLYDGLTDPTTTKAMGEQAERLAAAYQVTRPELDEVALYSQQRAAIATEQGRWGVHCWQQQSDIGWSSSSSFGK